MGKRFYELLNGFDESIASKLPAVAVDTFAKADQVINNSGYERIAVSISGGGDSDIMLDVLWRIDVDKKCKYIFLNTGVEYRATLEHLDDLEKKYGITIERLRPKKTIPMCCREYGQPFLNKRVSDFMSRLQKHGFQWENETFDVLNKKYPNCKGALSWWTNTINGEGTTKIGISRNTYLKEFILQNPPTFIVSESCCTWTKKKVAHQYYKDNKIDLYCTGVRGAEGGQRRLIFSNCFSKKEQGADQYRPLFWWSDTDCADYRELMGIERSRCYTQYGFKRTGCAGCPFNRNLFKDMQVTIQFEPEMNKLSNMIFKDSYEYTKQFIEYKKRRYYIGKKREWEQISIFDEMAET